MIEKLPLSAIENFERYWVKRPLNNVRIREGYPPTTPEAIAEGIKQEHILFMRKHEQGK